MVNKPTLEINLIDPAVIADPHPTFARLRDELPVYWYKPLRGWIVSRHADATTILKHSAASSEFIPLTMQTVARSLRDQLAPAEQILNDMAMFNDAPRHTRLRNHFSRAFTPKRIAHMHAEITDLATHQATILMNSVTDNTVDFMQGFAEPFPVRVIAAPSLLDIPTAQLPALKQWSDSIITLQGGFIRRKNIAAEIAASVEHLRTFFGELIQARRTNPGGDLISALVAAQASDDALTDDEVIATCMLLLVAGHETTTNLLGNSLWALHQHGIPLATFDTDDENAIDVAVEELLRFEGPVVIVRRLMKSAVELHGETISAGGIAYVFLGSANRDADVFDDPDTLDLHRQPNPHLAFGLGSHYCIGAPLARLEAKIALPVLAQHIGAYEVVDTEWLPDLRLRGFKRLVLKVG